MRSSSARMSASSWRAGRGGAGRLRRWPFGHALCCGRRAEQHGDCRGAGRHQAHGRQVARRFAPCVRMGLWTSRGRGAAADRRRAGGGADRPHLGGDAGGRHALATRTMAAEVGLSQTVVARIWRAFGLQPHRSETFKLSTDPLFVEKVRDIIGLYLDPPDRALVLCVDEKSQIQALDRTAPILPMRPGTAERAHPRLCPPRHLQPVRRAGRDDRQGDRPLHSRHRAIEFRRFLQTGRPRGPCRSGRASHPRQRLHPQDTGDQEAGWPRTPVSTCTSPHPLAGSTWSSAGSAS